LNAVAGGPAPLLSPHPTHYERLGLAENASLAEIEAAWLALAPGLPPADPHAPSLVTPGTTETPALRAAAMRLAYAVLGNAQRRAVYDRWLASSRAATRLRWWQRLPFMRRR
jgi:curved DNA-binding protein CbpA